MLFKNRVGFLNQQHANTLNISVASDNSEFLNWNRQFQFNIQTNTLSSPKILSFDLIHYRPLLLYANSPSNIWQHCSDYITNSLVLTYKAQRNRPSTCPIYKIHSIFDHHPTMLRSLSADDRDPLLLDDGVFMQMLYRLPEIQSFAWCNVKHHDAAPLFLVGK